MTARTFFNYLITVIIVFIGINAIIWLAWTKQILAPSSKSGDLVRMGYLSGFKVTRQDTINLPRRHISMKDYSNTAIDIVTVGDSFSAGGGGGENSFYQDYISSYTGLRVLNVPSFYKSGVELQFQPIITLAKLINSGYLDLIKPKYLLLETIGRQSIDRLVYNFSINHTSSISDINAYFKNSSFELNSSKPSYINFINTGNYKFIRNSFLYRNNDKIACSKVVKSKLIMPLFDVMEKDSLLFYIDDIIFTSQANYNNISKMNANLNKISEILKSKGITFVFMPIVDKYDLYRPYLVNTSYPQNNFFDILRTLKKDYLFIDTKALLSPHVQAGEKDLYFADDTHWNWKAPQIIFSEFRFTPKDNK